YPIYMLEIGGGSASNEDVKLIMLVTDGNSSNWHSDFQAHSITSLR
ncbi:hypothetical protein Tco_1397090, partial [Tanacetum coccineum]